MSNAQQMARIENFFIFNARYTLSAKEQKVILYLVGRLRTSGNANSLEVLVPIETLQELLADKVQPIEISHLEIQRFLDSIIQKRIEFRSNVLINEKEITSRISWFQSIIPTHSEQGEVCLSFLFSEKLLPFLHELRQYTQLDYQEMSRLRSGFAIRIFQVFRTHRDRMARYEPYSVLRYSIAELKALLGVQGKYKDWRNFKRRIVDVFVNEINEYTSIKLDCTSTRQGRKIVGLEFRISDRIDRQKIAKQVMLFEPLEIPKMTRAQKMAFDMLVALGIRDTVVLEMVARLHSIDFKGFEDWFFEIVWRIFEQENRSKNQPARAGNFVMWFMDNNVFDAQSAYFNIISTVLQERKTTLQSQTQEWHFRQKAKTMTAADYERWYKVQNEINTNG